MFCPALLFSRNFAFAQNLALQPFSANSLWNSALAVDATLKPDGDLCTDDLHDPAVGTDINAAQWSQPVVRASKRDPRQRIWVNGRVVARLRIPRNAQPALPKWPLDPAADSHLNIIDPAKRYVHEMWRAQRVRGGFVAQYYVRNRLDGSGVGSGGTRAYGGSAIGGLIRTFEIKNLQINHVLALAFVREKLKTGFVRPATAEDAGSIGTYLGHVPMGTRIAIDHKVNISALGLTPVGVMLAHALQRHGAYVVDASSDLTLYAEPSAERLIQSARADLSKLKQFLQCVE